MGRDFLTRFSHQDSSKINFPFFVYDYDPTKEHFDGGANVRKMPVKS